jgi:hypothetical protein
MNEKGNFMTNQDTATLVAEIETLRGKIEEAQSGAADKEAVLEAAIAAGTATDAALDALAKIQARVEILQGVLAKTEVALTAAQQAEDQAAALALIDPVEQAAQKAVAAVQARMDETIVAAKDLIAKAIAFEAAVTELCSMNGAGVEFAQLHAPRAAGLLSAVGSGLPADGNTEAINQAGAALGAEVGTVASTLVGLITAARSRAGLAQ